MWRPARGAKQADAFHGAAQRWPEQAEWLSAGSFSERFPDVRAPHGALYVKNGGAVDVEAFIACLLQAAERRGAALRVRHRLTDWKEEDGCVSLDVEPDSGPERFRAKHAVLALGQDYPAFENLRLLPLHRIKGETIRLRRPEGLGVLPILAGNGYLVPDESPTEIPPLATLGRDDIPKEATLLAGSTYEHAFEDLAPSKKGAGIIRKKVARMIPALREAEVVESRAGARVKVPQSRYPLLDRLPGHNHVWMFTGLGSKGLLTAPMLASELPGLLYAPNQ